MASAILKQELIRTADKVPKKFLAHMEGTDGLLETRMEGESNIVRIFCFFDKGALVVTFNGFQKKMQKTPTQELELAKKLQKEYFRQKEQREKAGAAVEKKGKTKRQ